MQYEKSEGLKREIGVPGIFINVINNTIGSGIYLLPAVVAATLGNASIIAYVTCGLLFLLVMLCYAEISSQVTVSGGTYAYIEEAFGAYAGFISNAVFWFGVGVFVMAALVNGLADVLSVVFPVLKNFFYRSLFFIGVFAFTSYINIRGVKQGMILIKAITFIKLIPLFLLIIAAFWGMDFSNLSWDHTPSLQDLGRVSLILFFAFAGGESALNVSGEMKNPSRTAPLGILYGTLGTIFIFCLIQLTAQGVLGNELIKYKEAPLAAVAGKLVGGWGHALIIAASAAAIFGVLTSLPLVFPRVMYAGAKDRILPAFLAKVNLRLATPVNAIITFSAISLIVAVFGGFRQLAIIVSASLLLLYAGVVLAVIKFRFTKKAKQKDSFKIPGGLIVPVAALLVLIWFFIQLEWKEIIGASIFIAVLSIVYFIKKSTTKQTVENNSKE